MNIIKEFKEFAVKGNMFDMAVGIIIGTAFSAIVSSLVKDVITPVLGIFLGKMDFKDYRYVIQNAIINPDGTVFREAVTLNYGAFLQVCMDFVIISGSIFLVVKFLNALKRKAEDDKVTSTPTPKDIELLSEIRDLLKHDREHSSR
jgi:large conductance mechanosensitive channel